MAALEQVDVLRKRSRELLDKIRKLQMRSRDATERRARPRRAFNGPCAPAPETDGEPGIASDNAKQTTKPSEGGVRMLGEEREFISDGDCVNAAWESVTSETRPGPLLGYHWIAGMLDGEERVSERPEQFFTDLQEFRQLHRRECVSGSPPPESLPHSSLQPVHRYKSHRCQRTDPSDSFSLLSHCAWSGPSCSSASQRGGLDLRGSVRCSAPSQTTT